MNSVKVIYNNAEYQFLKGTTLYEISKEFEKDYQYPILAGIVNKATVSLNYEVTEDAVISFLDMSNSYGNKIYERSAILILVKAVRDVMGKEVRIEHSIDKGIYSIIDGLTDEKVKRIYDRMHEIVNASYPIDKLNVSRIKAIKYYKNKGLLDKAELLKYISNTYITMYRLDDVYDYMYGEMVINTSYIKDFELEYVGKNGMVLMLPLVYSDYKVSKYTHHEKLFNSIMDYVDWSYKIGIRNISDMNKMLSEGKWNDLIFMSEAIYNKSLLDIAEKVSKNKNIKVVLVAGPSCSGKTTTSKKLELFLKGRGLNPVAISVDDYFKERDETPLDENGNKDYESLRAVDTDLFNKQLMELIEGKEVLLPTFNFILGKKEYKRKLKLEENGILIIEGLHSLNDELTSLISDDKKYKIYISPLTCLNLDDHNRLNTTDNRVLRRIVRDNLRRGYNASATLKAWKDVRKGETKYVFPYQDKADVILNTSLIYEMSVLKVFAEPLLFSIAEDDPYYGEALRLINILRMILPMPSASIPLDSIMREFIGNGCFE